MTTQTLLKVLDAPALSHAKGNLEGIIWKLLACLAFAGGNTIVRYLTGGAHNINNPLSADVITFFQNIFAFCIMFPFALSRGIGSLKTKAYLIPQHSIRIISGVSGIIFLYMAFSKMPMAQAVALQFTGPIFSVIGARLYLKERIGFYQGLAILLGMTGAFIITRPDHALMGMPGSLGWLALLPIGSAIAFAVAKIMGRELGVKGESAELLSTYLIFFMIPAAAFPATMNWVTPTLTQLGLLTLLGACGCLAHYSTSKAYCLAEVSFLTPFGFARIIFTAILGYLLYKEMPKSAGLWIGFGFIVLSTYFMTIGEKKKAPGLQEIPARSG